MVFHRGTRVEFENALARLKTEGCNVLVKGRAPDAALDRLSADFLGDAPNRARIFALFDRNVDAVVRRLRTAGPGYEPVTVVESAVDEPRSAAAQTPPSPGHELDVEVVDGTLDDVAAAVRDGIRAADCRHGPLDAGELRLCLDSLRPLTDRPDRELEQFLLKVTSAVRDANGMGHYVLPGDHAASVFRAPRTLFDVLVELRQHNGRIEQRWTIYEDLVGTEWMSF